MFIRYLFNTCLYDPFVQMVRELRSNIVVLFIVKLQSKILFQIPRLSVLPLSVILSVISPADKFSPQAPLEELDSTRAVGTF